MEGSLGHFNQATYWNGLPSHLNINCNLYFSIIVSKYAHLKDTYTKHPEVWRDKRNRKMACNILISMGTTMFLDTLTTDDNDDIIAKVAHAIIGLENYVDRGDNAQLSVLGAIFCNRNATTKYRVLTTSGSLRRDLLKFFSKRMSCSCLKNMHSEARNGLPKMGICVYCKEEKSRASLMVCSECRIDQYCSRECQVGDWHRHARVCGIYISAQEDYIPIDKSNEGRKIHVCQK